MQILRQHLFTGALVAAALLSNPASAAIYMAFGGIQGTVTEPGYENRIALDSAQWGQVRAISLAQGSPQISPLTGSEVSVSKPADLASSGLAAALLSNVEKDVIISVVNNGLEHLRLELCGALVSSLSTSAGGGPSASEAVSFSFRAYRLTYFDSNGKDGGAGGPVQWDFSTNTVGSCAANPV